MEWRRYSDKAVMRNRMSSRHTTLEVDMIPEHIWVWRGLKSHSETNFRRNPEDGTMEPPATSQTSLPLQMQPTHKWERMKEQLAC
jgi:hypothetical protein